ncbi:heterokaryon incompatibility protein-domain-containing protein [Immersiella caudata]|uniref:Heterokaryon incompatibility protein-domain-containing protein n=1 Tax=Immersiella caudata TaxID=314043 RepID=A0AA40C4N0_9PEZI|nr:heterokaryon incompatibility protein-domain-containing protein [Immersiella caudata]
MKQHRVDREGLVQVYEHCPRRPYVELVVPSDCAEVTTAVFITLSRDQGRRWADDSISNTWFEVALRRPKGRTDVSTIRIQHNRAGNPEFFEFKTRWDVQESGRRLQTWLWLLRPGDVIQIVPKAVYTAWVNIIQSASIEIEYRERDAAELVPSPASSTDQIAPFYSPLDYNAQQIRVLVVDSGELGEEIQARFEHISLEGDSATHNAFHALSYCWGESTERFNITIRLGDRESVLPVSPTVKRAICRLRKPNEQLRIWIDAVCINQDDLEERANQVALMGQIYSRAEEVHVWLDEEMLALDESLRLIRDVYNCNHRVCPGGDQCVCSGTKHILTTDELDSIIEETKSPTFGYVYGVFGRHRETPYFDSVSVEVSGGEGNINLAYFVENFFHHPWFQRVWVVQEAILAPKTTVHSATEAVGWDEVLLLNEITSSLEFNSSAANLRMRTSMPSVWKTLVHDQGALDGTPPLTILQVFLAALDMKATDPRDKLFALLPFGRETGQGKDIPPALRPDYGKPLARVLADFTRWWIAEYQSLDILSLIHRQPARAWRRTLCDKDPAVSAPVASPTWAVGIEGYAQWSNMTLGERFPSCFRACGGRRPDQALLASSKGLDLSLRGWRLGTIIALGYPPRELVYAYTGEIDDGSSLNVVFHRMFDPSGRTGEWMLLGNNHDLGKEDLYMLQRILDGHRYGHYGYLSTPEQLQEVLRPVEGEGGEIRVERCQSNGLPSCVEKCYFVTSDGRCGLCPWTAKEGDVVTILQGGKVPYLLRPLEKTSPGELDKYALVSECFVEGVMAGVSLEDGTDRSEVFVLS